MPAPIPDSEALLKELAATPEVSPPWTPPQRFDGLQLVRRLGRGGMGEVFEAEDTVLERTVAVKFISAPKPQARRKEQHLVEARALARLSHPNVVSVHRVGAVDDRPYFVTEAVAGRTLDQIEIPDFDAAMDITLQVAQGLAAAHRARVVHRDVKPSNVMMSDDGVVKLIDFGLARLDGAEITSVGGTPGFMAPEVRAGLKSDARADVWGLGILLFYLLTKKIPHVDDDLASLVANDLDLPPRLDGLRAIVERCVRQDPAERYSSAVAVRDALESIKPRAKPSAATPATGGEPTVRYADNDGVEIAYQVWGSGPVDIVLASGWLGHLEVAWQYPPNVAFFRALGELGRVITFDKRGTGMSNRTSSGFSYETRVSDILAVMNTARSERAVIFGLCEGGATSAMFAAQHPERCRGIIALGSSPRALHAPGYDVGIPLEAYEGMYALVPVTWGGPTFAEVEAPSMADDPEFRSWWARYIRNGGTSTDAIGFLRATSELDVREILPEVTVPALVMHAAGDQIIPSGAGRALAETLPNAKFVELDGHDHVPFGDIFDEMMDNVRPFIGGLTSREDDRPTSWVTTALSIRAEEIESLHPIVQEQFILHRGIQLEVSDSFRAIFDKPVAAVFCAHEVLKTARARGLEVSAGVHIGHGGDVHSSAIELAHSAPSGSVVVSDRVRNVVAGSNIELTPHLDHAFVADVRS